MRRAISTMCLLSFGLCWGACDNGRTLKNPSDVILSSDGVVWNGSALATTITAQAVDEDGQPVRKALIELTHDGDGLAVDPVILASDVNGEVQFAVSTTKDGPVNFQARLPDSLSDIGQPLQVDLSLTLTLEAEPIELTSPGGLVDFTASVSDSSGPVVGLELALASDRAADVFDPVRQDSDSAGEATFQVTTMDTGSAMISLSVPALDPGAGPSVAMNFSGPTLSGNWSLDQPGAVIQTPRIGALWLNISGDIQAEYRELVSVPMDEVPALGSSGTYGLNLPLNPPQADLYRPEPGDPDLPESFVIAAYLIGIYDDLDDDGTYSAGDRVISLSDENFLLAYAEGELPTPEVLPGLSSGYQFMNPFTDDENPELVALELMADQHDLAIDMASCPSVSVSGKVTFGDTIAPDANVRVAIMLLDAGLIFSGQADQMFNSGNYYTMADIPLTFVPNTEVDYQLDLPLPSDVHADYGDLLVGWGAGMPDVGLLTPMVYLDWNDDKVFTNDDNDITTHDLLVGSSDQPFGYDHTFLEWIDGPVPLILSLMAPGINEGYNLFLAPLNGNVLAVTDDNTLTLDKEIEGGHSGLPFRIEREVPGGDDLLILEGSDLSTGQNMGYVVTSAGGGFNGLVQAGDKLTITVEMEDTLILDFDNPLDLITR